jgi:pyridoxine 4-dehydrogenase
MKAALNAGSNFWNGGDFYGTPEYNSLHLLKAYFEKYPEDADKVVLSIKSGLNAQFHADGSVETVKAKLDEYQKHLGGVKKLDIFEYARVPTNVDFYTVTLPELQKYVDNGTIGGIGLSEVNAATIRKAAQVVKVAAVEIELSLWSTDILTNGVGEAAGELGIPLIAYSPLGRGILTGQIKSMDDLPEGDLRRGYPRFQPDVFQLNLELVRRLEEVAAKNGWKPSQLAIAWTRQVSQQIKGHPTILPIPGATTEARVLENTKVVELDEETLKEISRILAEVEIVGGRYPKGMPIEG